jgi:hypothetical protein
MIKIKKIMMRMMMMMMMVFGNVTSLNILSSI